MNTITWRIEQLRMKTTPNEPLNIILEATWLCEARNGELSACKTGVVNLSGPSANCINDQSLTECAVLQSCYDNGVDKAQIEQEALEMLGLQEGAPQFVRLPWEGAA